MTERDETILAIKLLQDDIPNLNQAIQMLEDLNLDASDLIARRNAKKFTQWLKDEVTK